MYTTAPNETKIKPKERCHRGFQDRDGATELSDPIIGSKRQTIIVNKIFSSKKHFNMFIYASKKHSVPKSSDYF